MSIYSGTQPGVAEAMHLQNAQDLVLEVMGWSTITSCSEPRGFPVRNLGKSQANWSSWSLYVHHTRLFKWVKEAAWPQEGANPLLSGRSGKNVVISTTHNMKSWSHGNIWRRRHIVAEIPFSPDYSLNLMQLQFKSLHCLRWKIKVQKQPIDGWTYFLTLKSGRAMTE